MASRRLLALLGATGIAAFGLACGVSSTDVSTSGSVRLSVTALGEARDTAFLFRFDSDTTAYEVFADSSRTFSAAEGSHSVELDGVAENCVVEGDNPRSVEVVAGQEVAVFFEVACTLNGSAKLTIVTTGVDVDDMYTLDFNAGFRSVLVGPNQFVTLSLPVGAYVVSLTGVASNCTVSTPNPVALEVVGQQVAAASFAVSCVPR
ncbi:MAG: hypothetical protein AMXMBFR53_21110 [Gemmatimonadota bacterium]